MSKFKRNPTTPESRSICGLVNASLLLLGVGLLYVSLYFLREDIMRALQRTRDCVQRELASGQFVGVTAETSDSRSPSKNRIGFFSTSSEGTSITGRKNPLTPKFFLYRLIGNNMPPLQCFGQLLKNTRYALKYEPDFPDCRKIWVLNNIVNETERALLLDALIRAGYTMQDIIVRRVNFTSLMAFPRDSWIHLVTAQNAARNEMMRHGIAEGARWILAFDGNQFFTSEAWNATIEAAKRWEEQGLKYFKVPMYRLYSEQDAKWLNGASSFRAVRNYAPVLWESQMAFRSDSEERYVEDLVYGKDNKLELIDRVCGTGRFDEKATDADTGRCGCHREAGNERRQRAGREEAALHCGYSLRLWYHPCPGVNASRIFVDRKYRASLRDRGHRLLKDYIAAEVKRHAQLRPSSAQQSY